MLEVVFMFVAVYSGLIDEIFGPFDSEKAVEEHLISVGFNKVADKLFVKGNGATVVKIKRLCPPQNHPRG